jgi:sugar lactone lactonase YvrE
MPDRALACALACSALLAALACGAPATPTPKPVLPAINATAAAAAAATREAAHPTASPTPALAVGVVAPLRLWAVELDSPPAFAGRAAGPGEKLVKVGLVVENADTKVLTVAPTTLASGVAVGGDEPVLGFALQAEDGASYRPLGDLYPPLPPVALPPGYRLPHALLFSVPAPANPTRLAARGVQHAAGEAVIDLGAVGRIKPQLPSRLPFAARPFAQIAHAALEYDAAVTAVAAADGRVRVRLEVHNRGLDEFDVAKLVGVQAIGANGDMRVLEPTAAPPRLAVGAKLAWQAQEKRAAPESWYYAGGFQPVQVLVTLRASRPPNAVVDRFTYVVPPEELNLPGPTPGLVTTLAGSTIDGFGDGKGVEASFDGAVGVAAGPDGFVYVADSHNNRVRKVSPVGEVTTVAGSGEPGFGDGPGRQARLNEPRGLAIDAAGNLYVADTINNRIRKVSAAGEVTTLAGGPSGFADGVAREARFRYPRGVAVDAAGNVYVADKDNDRVRKVSPAGDVTTLAGAGVRGYADGPAAQARFAEPEGVAVDAAGNVYVADGGNHRIRKITPGGEVTTVAGATFGFRDGPAEAARFNTPRGLAVDAAGSILVADAGNHRVRRITPDGAVTTVAGSGEKGYDNGPGRQARFNEPFGVAVDAAGNIYVADLNNYRIRKVAGPV